MGFAKTMAVELAQYGCTVNSISPGMVDTALLKDMPHKLIELTAHNNPLKRIASPEDISNVVSFLASDETDYLNGVNIPVNGGGVIL
jgi:3-oxoacyl-[acyl-carrier protein] reductase